MLSLYNISEGVPIHLFFYFPPGQNKVEICKCNPGWKGFICDKEDASTRPVGPPHPKPGGDGEEQGGTGGPGGGGRPSSNLGDDDRGDEMIPPGIPPLGIEPCVEGDDRAVDCGDYGTCWWERDSIDRGWCICNDPCYRDTFCQGWYNI